MASGRLKGKWKLISGIVIGLIAAGLAGWYFLGNKETVQAQTVSVPVTKGTIDVRVSGTGNVEPADISNVIAKVGGNIAAIQVANGQKVTKGQLLFKLDDSKVQTQIEKARIDYRQTQTDINKSREQLAQQQVYAPMGGRITSIQVTEGQDVNKGAVMMTILDINNLTFQVPFNNVSDIKVGQQADVTITDLGASGLTGRVTKVNRNAVGDKNGTLVYYATVLIDNPGALVPGMQGQAAVHSDKGLIYGYSSAPLEWVETAVIRAGVSGNLTRLTVEENMVVQKGQLLATLDADSVKSQADSQTLKLQQSTLNIADLEKELPDYLIYATADGIFTMTASSETSNNKNAASASAGASDKWQPGDEVKTGQIVGVINDSAGMIVTVPVDEVDIAKVKLGQKADITFDALPDKKYTGTVSDIADQGVVSNSAATFDVEVTLDQTDGVKPAMTANVDILVNHKEGALLVPIEAVQDRGGRKFVILDGAADGGNRRSGSGPGSGSGAGPGRNSRTNSDSGSGNSSGGSTGNNSGSNSGSGSRPGNPIAGNMTPVETGLYNETTIEITRGVKEGDRVVLPSVTRNTGGNNGGGIRVPMGGGLPGGNRQIYTSRPGGR